MKIEVHTESSEILLEEYMEIEPPEHKFEEVSQHKLDDILDGFEQCERNVTKLSPDAEEAGQKLAEYAFRVNKEKGFGCATLQQVMMKRLAREFVAGKMGAFVSVLPEDEIFVEDIDTASEEEQGLEAFLAQSEPSKEYVRLLAMMQSSSSDASKVASILSSLPKMNDFLINFVNVSGKGYFSEVTSLKRAVSMLGFNEVAAAVLAMDAIAKLGGKDEKYWFQAVVTGIVARQLAEKIAFVPEYFFFAGLLADVGAHACRLTQMRTWENIIDLAACSPVSRHEAEKWELGENLGKYGARLLQSWGAPKQISEIVRLRENPAEAEYLPAVCILHLAERIGQAMCFSAGERLPISKLDEQCLTSLAIDPSILIMNQQKIMDEAHTLHALLPESNCKG